MDIRLKYVPTASLRSISPFKDLMPHDEKTIARIAKSMRKEGYDSAWPIVVWAGHENIIVDGHLRFAAARIAGLKEVYIAERQFQTENDACLYSLHNNVFRGHYSDAELDQILEDLNYADLQRMLNRLLANFHVSTIEVTL